MTVHSLWTLASGIVLAAAALLCVALIGATPY